MAELKNTIVNGILNVNGDFIASKIIKRGGTSDDILMGDGSTASKQELIDSLEAAMSGVNDGTLTLKASDGVTATQQTFTANDADSVTFEVKHAAPTGAAAGSYGPSAGGEQTAKGALDITVPQITTDKFGHVTGVTNQTFTVTDTDTTYNNATTTTDGLMSADDKKNLTYYVKGTQTAATGSWTGSLPQVSALYEGLTIRYKLPYAGSGNATLNLTLASGTSGAKKIYRYGTTTQITTHFSAGSVITMTYDGTNWIADAFYYTSDGKVRQYQHGENEAATTNQYPLLARYGTTNKNGSYESNYSRFHTEAYVDVSDGSLTAKGFKYNDTTTGTNEYILLAGGGTKALADFGLSNNTSFNPADYQPKDDDLTAIAGLTGTSGLLKKTAANTWTLDTTTYSTFSGSYNDLTNKPTIPAAQIQSDWNQTDTSKVDYIKNKPTIPTIPTDIVSGSGLTADKIIVGNGNSAIKTTNYSIYTSTTPWSTSQIQIPTCAAVDSFVETNVLDKMNSKGNRAAGDIVTAASAGAIHSVYYVFTEGETARASWGYNATTDCVELAWR